jgi:hypothetical protein
MIDSQDYDDLDGDLFKPNKKSSTVIGQEAARSSIGAGGQKQTKTSIIGNSCDVNY